MLWNIIGEGSRDSPCAVYCPPLPASQTAKGTGKKAKERAPSRLQIIYAVLHCQIALLVQEAKDVFGNQLCVSPGKAMHYST